MLISTEFSESLRVITPNIPSVDLTLVGCGGTGSWLAPAIARVARWLIETGRQVNLIFIDPDTVEEKNIFRQNFCDAEIGMNKADALARRYGRAWGLTIGCRQERFDGSQWNQHSGFGVICGCVDGPDGRKEIDQMIDRTSGLWWLDSGNTSSYGQVLIGRSQEKYSRIDPLQLPGYTNWLPTPAMQHPELVEVPLRQAQGTDREPEMELSCAEMALRDSQGMAINQRMAAEMADYLVRLLITKDLRKYATYIDLETGTSTSKYITAEAVKKWMK